MTATTRLSFSRTIAILIFIASAVILVNPISAQESTRSAIKKENLTQKMEARKEAVNDKLIMYKEKMASREAALKTKLDAFKDKQKAQVVDRVNTNLNKLNQHQTGQMQMHLDKMGQLLNKLEDRVNAKTPDIKDPTSARTAIDLARQNIATASAAVVTQAQKDYTITVTSESRVKIDAQKMRDLLKTDLMTLRKTVIDTKQSVSNAIKIARMEKEGTPSGQQ